MGKSQPQAPTPVDPVAVANAQTASNKETAQFQSVLNNGNSTGPYGSVTNTQGANGQWNQNTTLSPAEQAIFNAGTSDQAAALGVAGQQIGRVGTALGQTVAAPTISGSIGGGGTVANGFGQGQGVQGQIGPQNFGDAVNNTVQANYAQQMGLLQPQMDQASEHQNAQLIAQGLNPNDTAWQNSQTLFNNGQAQQRAQVADNAVNSGNAEQNTLFGQQAQQGQFANAAAAQQYSQNQGQAAFQNTAQQQQFQQAAARQAAQAQAQQANFQNANYAQQAPINEFTALMGSNQVSAPSPAQLSSTGVAPTDVTGAYALNAQQQQANYQAQMQNYQSGMGGLFSLGSAALGLL